MSFDPTSARRLSRPALGLLLLVSFACGHKDPPFPPPLRHPATTKDLVAQQRGDEIILSFTYPLTTVSGTPLEPLQTVEYWHLERAAPQWTPPEMDSETEPGVEDEDAVGAPAQVDDEATSEDSGPTTFEGLAGSGDDPSTQQVPRATDPLSDPDDDAESAVPDTDTEDESPPDEAVDAEESEDVAPPQRPTDEELLAVDKREFAATATIRATLEDTALTSSVFGDRIVLTLPMEALAEATAKASETEGEDVPEDESGELVRGSAFAIKTAVSSKFISDLSNVAIIARRTAPEPPAAFSLEPGPDKITLRWPVDHPDLLGYHVYRRDAQSPTYGPPLAFVPLVQPGEAAEDTAVEEEETLEERTHTDRSAVYGQRYIYALTAVSSRTPVVESAIALEREVDYDDRFPPSAPKNLIALAESGRVRLLWNASPQSDVVGYTVSRREGDGAFQPLHTEPIVELEYSDRDIRGGQSYVYRVVAIDGADNESQPSEEVEARVP